MTTSSSNDELRIFCLPVSGGHFPIQLGIMTALSTAFTILKTRNPETYSSSKTHKPNIVLASSGGNIVSYYAQAADWDRTRIYSAVDHIRSDSFMASWTEYIPSWIFLPFSKSLFRPGFGFMGGFERMFTRASLREGPEIWTGVCLSKYHSHRLFTNKAKGETLIVPKNIKDVITNKELHLSTNIEPVYMDGDLSLAADITLASASIPWLVKPVRVDSHLYTDGGGMFSSPITILREAVCSLATEQNKILRLFYFSPSNITKDIKSTMDFVSLISDFLRASRSCDLRTFVSIITTLGADYHSPSHYENLTSEGLANLIQELDSTHNHYGIILFPTCQIDPIDLTCIHPIIVRRYMVFCENNFSAFVWKP